MKLVWEAMKHYHRASSAVAVALLERRPLIAGQRAGVIRLAAIADLDHLPWGALIDGDRGNQGRATAVLRIAQWARRPATN